MDTASNRPAFVYVLQAGAAVKIGVAVNIGARLAALQSGNPLPIAIVGRRKFSSSTDALFAERELHRRFADQRAAGEWFWIPAYQAIVALDHFNAEPRRVEGPLAPTPAPAAAFSFDDQIRLMADAVFYEEA